MQSQEKPPRSNRNHNRYFEVLSTPYAPVQEEVDEDEEYELQVRLLEQFKKQPGGLKKLIQSASKMIGNQEYYFENDSFGTSSHMITQERNQGHIPGFLQSSHDQGSRN